MTTRKLMSFAAALALLLATFTIWTACGGNDDGDDGADVLATATHEGSASGLDTGRSAVDPSSTTAAGDAGGAIPDDGSGQGAGNDGATPPASERPPVSTLTPQVARESGISADVIDDGGSGARQVRIDVRISGSEVPPYKAFQAMLEFDPELLTLVSAQPAPSFTDHFCTPPTQNEPGLLGYGCTLLTPGVLQSELLFSLTLDFTGRSCATIHFRTFEEAGALGTYLVNADTEPVVIELNDVEIC